MTFKFNDRDKSPDDGAALTDSDIAKFFDDSTTLPPEFAIAEAYRVQLLKDVLSSFVSSGITAKLGLPDSVFEAVPLGQQELESLLWSDDLEDEIGDPGATSAEHLARGLIAIANEATDFMSFTDGLGLDGQSKSGAEGSQLSFLSPDAHSLSPQSFKLVNSLTNDQLSAVIHQLIITIPDFEIPKDPVEFRAKVTGLLAAEDQNQAGFIEREKHKKEISDSLYTLLTKNFGHHDLSKSLARHLAFWAQLIIEDKQNMSNLAFLESGGYSSQPSYEIMVASLLSGPDKINPYGDQAVEVVSKFFKAIGAGRES